jgi:hypothetical protein
MNGSGLARWAKPAKTIATAIPRRNAVGHPEPRPKAAATPAALARINKNIISTSPLN